MNEYEEDFEPEYDGPSKSQVKREMKALQDLGERLATLNPDTRRRLPLSEALLNSLAELDKIKAHGARRRQLRFVGKVMQKEDAQAIGTALDELNAPSREQVRIEKLSEEWRQRLLDDDGSEAMTEFLTKHPDTDRNQFRQLVRSAVAERKAEKPPEKQRKLLRFVRGILKQHSVTDAG